MTPAAIKKALNSGAGKALKDYLTGKLFELRDIENVQEKGSATEQALELKATRRAYFKLREILSEIVDMEDTHKKKDKRDSFQIL